jgi:hypothetical protein
LAWGLLIAHFRFPDAAPDFSRQQWGSTGVFDICSHRRLWRNLGRPTPVMEVFLDIRSSQPGVPLAGGAGTKNALPKKEPHPTGFSLFPVPKIFPAG